MREHLFFQRTVRVVAPPSLPKSSLERSLGESPHRTLHPISPEPVYSDEMDQAPRLSFDNGTKPQASFFDLEYDSALATDEWNSLVKRRAVRASPGAARGRFRLRFGKVLAFLKVTAFVQVV